MPAETILYLLFVSLKANNYLYCVKLMSPINESPIHERRYRGNNIEFSCAISGENLSYCAFELHFSLIATLTNILLEF